MNLKDRNGARCARQHGNAFLQQGKYRLVDGILDVAFRSILCIRKLIPWVFFLPSLLCEESDIVHVELDIMNSR